MNKIGSLIKTFIIISIIILIISSSFVYSIKIHQNSSTRRDKTSYKIWVNKNMKYILRGTADTANSDWQMHMFRTHEILRKFFEGCYTPKDFYDRVNECIEDAKFFPDIWIAYFLPRLVYLVEDGHARMWCTQQVMLLAAGVKAVFSHWDEKLQRYVLNEGIGDFRFEFWDSCDETMLIPIRSSHLQLVVDTWNGDTMPMGYEKLEIDPWMNQFREWKPENEKHPGIVSIMYTSEENEFGRN